MAVCRTCLSNVAIGYVNLAQQSTITQDLKQQLQICAPEVNLNLATTGELVLCSSCLHKLQVSYKFRNMCINTEGNIKDYVQGLLLRSSIIDLGQVSDQKDKLAKYCKLDDDCIEGIKIESIEAEEQVRNVDLTNVESSPDLPSQELHSVDITRPSCSIRYTGIRIRNDVVPSSKRAKIVADDVQLVSRNEGKVIVYNCPDCNYVAKTKQELRTHVIIYHLDKIPETTVGTDSSDNAAKVCSICKVFVATSLSMLNQHIATDHAG